MAALYLHNALFGPQISAPPVLAHRSSSSGSSFDHQGSLHSSVTLHQTSPGPHSTESTYYGQPSETVVCASRPDFTGGARDGSELRLTLEGHPVQLRERRARQERRVRRRLRQLRWASRGLLLVIVAWTVQCMVRYFIASTIYTTRKRQIILIILGICSTLATVLIVISLLFLVYSYRSVCSLRSRYLVKKLSALLFSAAFFLVTAPAIVNLVLVFSWRKTSDGTSISGRCHWDIDVAWGGTGRQCSASTAPAWGYWLAGAVLRLCLTTAVLVSNASSIALPADPGVFTRNDKVAHYAVSYYYRITRQPSRSSRPSHPRFISWRSASSRRGGSTAARTEAASFQSEDSEHRSSWKMRSRSMLQVSTERPPLSVVHSQMHSPARFDSDDHASMSLGKSAHQSEHTPDCGDQDGSESIESEDLADFLSQFRAAIGGSRREVGESRSSEDLAVASAEADERPQQRYRVPIVGRSIHRMSTIESIGSPESASVYCGERSVHTISRPLTRSNTINVSEGRSSRSGSRRPSLDAGPTLSSPVSASMSEGLAAGLSAESASREHGGSLTSSPTGWRGSPPPWSRGPIAQQTARLSSVEELG